MSFSVVESADQIRLDCVLHCLNVSLRHLLIAMHREYLGPQKTSQVNLMHLLLVLLLLIELSLERCVRVLSENAAQEASLLALALDCLIILPLLLPHFLLQMLVHVEEVVVVQENVQELVEQRQVLLTGVQVRLPDSLTAPDVHTPTEQELDSETCYHHLGVDAERLVRVCDC